ncbi:DNA polymerase delta subunit 3 [Orussus abietinus]|uniref:DNA polymerase delta subunit 3 n=1 Tax=Orussus abietinus TaxID=222816 RepID=UPI000625AE88|nr:DNA polymerase delta subunit 3 [Orussus abietinus]
MDSYMEILSGYVYDEDKLVTYKWLSKELEVHVNIAKQILWSFREKHKDRGDIESTFMLMGNLSDGSMRVEVVGEASREREKEKFTTLICEHMYSVQKSLPDIQLLCIAGEGDCRFSAIKCSESGLLSDEEYQKLMWGDLYKNVPQIKNDQPKKSTDKTLSASLFAETDGPESSDGKEPISNMPKKSTKAQQDTNPLSKPENQQKHLTSPSNTVASSKTEQAKKTSPGTIKKSSTKGGKATLPVKTGPINSFFRKATQKQETQSTIASISKAKNEIVKPVEDAACDAIPNKDISPKPSKPILEESKEQKKVKESKESKPKQKKYRGTKRNRSQESSDAAKKRKRIIAAPVSSEESATSEDEGEPSPGFQEVLPSPPQEVPSSPPEVLRIAGRATVRRIVDTTYVDEDGFLVTEKVTVHEVCSDQEDITPEPAKKEPTPSPVQAKGKKNAKNSKNSTSKTKQSTLTSFFKPS